MLARLLDGFHVLTSYDSGKCFSHQQRNMIFHFHGQTQTCWKRVLVTRLASPSADSGARGSQGDSGSAGQLRTTLVLGRCQWGRYTGQEGSLIRSSVNIPIVAIVIYQWFHNRLTKFLNIYQLVTISWYSWVPTWCWGLHPGGHWASCRPSKSSGPLGEVCSRRQGKWKVVNMLSAPEDLHSRSGDKAGESGPHHCGTLSWHPCCWLRSHPYFRKSDQQRQRTLSNWKVMFQTAEDLVKVGSLLGSASWVLGGNKNDSGLRNEFETNQHRVTGPPWSTVAGHVQRSQA